MRPRNEANKTRWSQQRAVLTHVVGVHADLVARDAQAVAHAQTDALARPLVADEHVTSGLRCIRARTCGDTNTNSELNTRSDDFQ